MRARRSFSERSPLVIGAVGILAVLVVVMIALENQKLTIFHHNKRYSAYFADTGGLFTGAVVQVSGFPVGRVSKIELTGPGALVTFDVASNIHLGDRTEAAIRTKGLLGTKELDVTPAGGGQLSGPIPIERTVSPYQLPDALGDLAAAISGINTSQLSDSLATLANTFADTPPSVKIAVEGVARFAQTLDARDAQLRNLLDNANKATAVLAKRTDRIVSLVRDTNVLLAQLRTQSAVLDQIANSISAAARQLQGFIGDNRQQLKSTLDKLNGVLAIVDDRKERLQRSIKQLNVYAMGLGETVASGPFFKAYVVNLLPGQFIQPFVDAAFSDLGLDPATELPSQLTDPQTGQPGTPPLPMPYPRTGQGGEPRRNLPDAITGNPDDHLCGVPDAPLPGPGCYPYRQPLPAPPPGGPPPGPPPRSPGEQSTPGPMPAPVILDVGPPTVPGGPS